MEGVNEQKNGFFERKLPRGSIKRLAAVTTFCVASAVGALHYEVSRLKDSQETSIGEVKNEVTQQGANMKDPLIDAVEDAKTEVSNASATANKKLEVCEVVAESLGIEVDIDAETERAAGESATTTTTTTTVPNGG